MLTFTDRAAEALATFQTAAARWNPDVRIRLVAAGTELRPELAEAPQDDDVPVAVGALTVFVPSGVDGVVDAGEHNALIVSRG
jgi:Fe-S cluster assembly iron-binding protein IscA